MFPPGCGAVSRWLSGAMFECVSPSRCLRLAGSAGPCPFPRLHGGDGGWPLRAPGAADRTRLSGCSPRTGTTMFDTSDGPAIWASMWSAKTRRSGGSSCSARGIDLARRCGRARPGRSSPAAEDRGARRSRLRACRGESPTRRRCGGAAGTGPGGRAARPQRRSGGGRRRRLDRRTPGASRGRPGCLQLVFRSAPGGASFEPLADAAELGLRVLDPLGLVQDD